MTHNFETNSGAGPRQLNRQGNIVKIASGKGGVGKTWLSICLAQSLALGDRQVLLLDADLGLANIDVQLGFLPDRDLSSVVAGQIRLHQAVMPFADNSVGAASFDVIAGDSGSGILSGMTATQLGRLRRDIISVSRDYDWVLVDLAAGLEPGVTSLSGLPGPTLVIVTDEPASLTDAYAYIKMMIMSDERADIRIVINRAIDDKAGHETYDALQRTCTNFLGFTPALAGIIPSDPRVATCIRAQVPYLSRHPHGRIAAVTQSIADSLGIFSPPPPSASPYTPVAHF